MYVCGITPYDATHLGHAATYLAFDLVNRFWRDLGHDVNYVQNVTDIDDPLLERAARDQDDWVVLGMRETALFREDMEALRVVPPRHYIGAVEAMGEIAELVGEAAGRGRGLPRRRPGVSRTSTSTARVTGHFGYESRYDEETMLRLSRERGGDPDRPGKRHPSDALLWRMARDGEPFWESDLGAGRPGWHVECAAIALNRLGPQIDVNGGGSDLIFPHHECGAAHAEAHTGVHPFAKHYVHAGMIGLDGEKMSKCRGQPGVRLQAARQGVDPNAIRLALLAGHYRSDRAVDRRTCSPPRRSGSPAWRAAVGAATPARTPADLVAALRAHLADDLDTPGALAAVDAWAAGRGATRPRRGWSATRSTPCSGSRCSGRRRRSVGGSTVAGSSSVTSSSSGSVAAIDLLARGYRVADQLVDVRGAGRARRIGGELVVRARIVGIGHDLIYPVPRPITRRRRDQRAALPAPAQVALEVGRDLVAAGLRQVVVVGRRLGLLLELADVLAHLVVRLRHLGDGALPLLGLLGQRAQRHLDVEDLLDAVQQRHRRLRHAGGCET